MNTDSLGNYNPVTLSCVIYLFDRWLYGAWSLKRQESPAMQRFLSLTVCKKQNCCNPSIYWHYSSFVCFTEYGNITQHLIISFAPKVAAFMGFRLDTVPVALNYAISDGSHGAPCQSVPVC